MRARRSNSAGDSAVEAISGKKGSVQKSAGCVVGKRVYLRGGALGLRWRTGLNHVDVLSAAGVLCHEPLHHRVRAVSNGEVTPPVHDRCEGVRAFADRCKADAVEAGQVVMETMLKALRRGTVPVRGRVICTCNNRREVKCRCARLSHAPWRESMRTVGTCGRRMAEYVGQGAVGVGHSCVDAKRQPRCSPTKEHGRASAALSCKCNARLDDELILSAAVEEACEVLELAARFGGHLLTSWGNKRGKAEVEPETHATPQILLRSAICIFRVLTQYASSTMHRSLYHTGESAGPWMDEQCNADSLGIRSRRLRFAMHSARFSVERIGRKTCGRAEVSSLRRIGVIYRPAPFGTSCT